MKYNKQIDQFVSSNKKHRLFVFDELVSLEIVSKTIHEEVIFFLCDFAGSDQKSQEIPTWKIKSGLFQL